MCFSGAQKKRLLLIKHIFKGGKKMRTQKQSSCWTLPWHTCLKKISWTSCSSNCCVKNGQCLNYFTICLFVFSWLWSSDLSNRIGMFVSKSSERLILMPRTFSLSSLGIPIRNPWGWFWNCTMTLTMVPILIKNCVPQHVYVMYVEVCCTCVQEYIFTQHLHYSYMLFIRHKCQCRAVTSVISQVKH